MTARDSSDRRTFCSLGMSTGGHAAEMTALRLHPGLRRGLRNTADDCGFAEQLGSG